MKKEIADKWVAALRSGKFKKTTDNLHTNYGYCCLGVLCELSPFFWDEDDKFPWPRVMLGKTTTLPEEVMEWAGMKSGCGLIILPDGKVQTPLTVANDDYRWDFNKIADHIEKYWKYL